MKSKTKPAYSYLSPLIFSVFTVQYVLQSMYHFSVLNMSSIPLFYAENLQLLGYLNLVWGHISRNSQVPLTTALVAVRSSIQLSQRNPISIDKTGSEITFAHTASQAPNYQQ